MIKISDTDLRDILKNPRYNNRTREIQCDCLFCGKEQHMYVSMDTQMFDCKRCHESGTIYKLLRHIDKLYLLGGATVVENERILSIRERQEKIEEDEDTAVPEVRLPVGFKVLRNSCEYLLGRNISPDLCVYYGIGMTNLVERYRNYIIIPIREDNKVVGFVGRYANKNVPNNKLRYSNSLHTDFAKLLLGYDEIITDKTNTVILVEGAFDKFAVDRYLQLQKDDLIKCVCTFGKKISKYQIQKLQDKHIERVILLYDFDAVREMKRYSRELEDNFLTNITFTTKKDIDECTREEALKVFENLYSVNDFCQNVVGKLKK
jgi:5S rRNA maturation endonuclease (ribonuclease M5)